MSSKQCLPMDGKVPEKTDLTDQQETTWFCAVLKAGHVMQVTGRVGRLSFVLATFALPLHYLSIASSSGPDPVLPRVLS